MIGKAGYHVKSGVPIGMRPLTAISAFDFRTTRV